MTDATGPPDLRSAARSGWPGYGCVEPHLSLPLEVTMDRSALIPDPDPAVPDRKDRRMFLTAGIGAIAAATINAMVNPHVASAASVVLGGANSSTRPTTFRNPKASASAKAIIGRTTYTGAALQAAGVFGQADGTDASGVWGKADKGVDATGVYGGSRTGAGVAGFGSTGVYGEGTVGTIGYSATLDGSGVLGIAEVDCLAGVSGIATTTDGVGVFGKAENGANATGIHGESATGYAGYFDGKVTVTADFSSPAAFTQVDHPTDPANRWYRQALVGSFEQVSVLSGNAVTGQNGRAVVRVPAIFEQTHEDVRYQLTPIGRSAAPFIARELADGRFTIDAGAEGVRISWQLTGLRTDVSARSRRLDVEAPKRGDERGRFLEPALYGRTAARSLRGRTPKRLAARHRPSARPLDPDS